MANTGAAVKAANNISEKSPKASTNKTISPKGRYRTVITESLTTVDEEEEEK